MARPKAKKNLSQSVRDFLTANPDAKAKAVVEALAAKGVTVKEGLVYAVKGSMKEKSNRKKKIAKAAIAAVKPSSNGQATPAFKADALTMIRDVKALAAKAGGYEKLIELAKALAE